MHAQICQIKTISGIWKHNHAHPLLMRKLYQEFVWLLSIPVSGLKAFTLHSSIDSFNKLCCVIKWIFWFLHLSSIPPFHTHVAQKCYAIQILYCLAFSMPRGGKKLKPRVLWVLLDFSSVSRSFLYEGTSFFLPSLPWPGQGLNLMAPHLTIIANSLQCLFFIFSCRMLVASLPSPV